MANEELKMDEKDLEKVAGGADMRVIGTATVITTGLNIRASADKYSALLGQTNAPAKYDVYEIVQNQNLIWYRIQRSMWIANDGTWVRFESR